MTGFSAFYRPNRGDVMIISPDGSNMVVPLASVATLTEQLTKAAAIPALAEQLQQPEETAWSAR